MFNPTVLAAAKDAGIPIAALVGILSIFAVIATINKQVNFRVFITIIGFAVVCTVCLMFILWLSTREIYQWVDTKTLADWAGNDEGWTDGSIPASVYCDRGREGNIATCWRNRPDGYPTNPPPRFKGNSKDGAWCTYKLKEGTTLAQATGKATGIVFICARVSL